MDPINTLWATARNDPFAYSIDGGSTWVPVSTSVISGSVWSNGLCGPKTVWKFYSQFDEGKGIWYFDETGWHTELSGFSATVFYNKPGSEIWCNQDDTLVVSVSSGAIRTRPGAPGTSWVTEYSGSSYIYDVHGTPDGSSVFAVQSISNSTVSILERSPGGSWTVAHSFSGSSITGFVIRVVSATEVWIGGREGVNGKIWKWNGSTLSEEFSDANLRSLGVMAMYMAENGSEGWAAYRSSGATYETSFVYYNGSSWSITQSVSYSSDCTDITQLDGTSTSAKLMLEDGSIREYNGSSWDTTYSVAAVTGCATPVRTFKWILQRLPGVPYLDSQTPATSTVDPQVLIDVNVLDSDDDLDVSTLNVYVNDGTGEVQAYQGGVGFLSPYNGVSSAVTTITNGINIVVDRTTDYPPGTVTVRITIDDTIANSIDESWSFAMAYQFEPYLDSQTPAPSSTSDDSQLLIDFNILDDQDDIDSSTINVYVDIGAGEVQAYNGSTFLAPYNGASSVVTSIANGYNVVVDRTSDYSSGLTITVRVTADDLAANSLDDSWSFSTLFPSDHVLWSIALNDPLSYSWDYGSSWDTVVTTAISGSVYENGLWGPKTSYKYYSLFDEGKGIQYFDGTAWNAEDATFSTTVSSSWYSTASVWCSEDDSIVALVTSNQIRVRPGLPGTAWAVELLDSNRFYDVHGTPDGSSVFAVQTITGSGAFLWERGAGTWTQVASLPDATVQGWWRVRVISATEVWITGSHNSRCKIWKWNGSTLTVEYDNPNWRTPGVSDLWMAEDGSEGWAIAHTNGPSTEVTFVRYNGSTWSDAQVVSYSTDVVGVTQLGNDTTTAIAALGDKSLRRYNGATWDTTYSGTPELTLGGSPLLISYQPFGLSVEVNPYLDNQSPTPSSTTPDPQILISVDVLDNQDDIDSSTINVYVNDGGGETLVYNGSSFIAPYNGASSAVTPIANGYNVVVDRTTDYLPSTVIVRVTAEDVLANALDDFWSFDVFYLIAPYLDNQNPAQDDYIDLVSFQITFDILDLQDDIDSSTIVVYVNDGTGEVSVYTAGGGFVAPYNGGSSSITPVANGYSIVLDRTTDYPRNVITVRATADDLAAHSMDESWDFTISPWIEKTALLPTQEDIPEAGDTYSAGTFTTAGSGRRLYYSYANAPIAYETLDSISADANAILRITANIASNNGTSNWVGGAIVLFSADRTDLFWTVAQDSSSSYRTYLFRTIDGVAQSAASVVGTLAAPKLVRMYWNASFSAFSIPEPGFSSYSIPARYASAWFSEDDGTTWQHVGDGQITDAVIPTRVGIASENYYQATGSIVVFDEYQVSQIDPPDPYLQNKYPEPSSTTTAIGTLVSVDIVDFQDDIDASTLEVTVNSVPAYTTGSFVAPFDGPSSALTKITNGYSLVIDNVDPYLTGVVTTRVIVSDVLANSMDSQWSFSVSADPYLENQSPAAGTTQTDDSLLISVDVVDQQADIDLGTLNITVSTVPAYTAGVGFVSPFDGPSSSVVAITNGYRITIDRATSFPSGSTDTRVTVDDTTGNSLDDSWAFTFNGYPYLGSVVPANGEVTGNFDVVISAEILDRQDDVDPSTIDVTINGSAACTSGVFVSPFNGPESEIVSIDGGYKVKLDHIGPLARTPERVTYSVSISADDLTGSSFADSWSFDVLNRTGHEQSHWTTKVDFYYGRPGYTSGSSDRTPRQGFVFVPGLGTLWSYLDNNREHDIINGTLPWHIEVYDGNKWSHFWEVTPKIDERVYSWDMVYDDVRDTLICVLRHGHETVPYWDEPDNYIYATYEIALNGGGTPTITRRGDIPGFRGTDQLNQPEFCYHLLWDSTNKVAVFIASMKDTATPDPSNNFMRTYTYNTSTGNWTFVVGEDTGTHPARRVDPIVGFMKSSSTVFFSRGRFYSYVFFDWVEYYDGWEFDVATSTWTEVWNNHGSDPTAPVRVRPADNSGVISHSTVYSDSLGGLVVAFGSHPTEYWVRHGLWLWDGSIWSEPYYGERIAGLALSERGTSDDFEGSIARRTLTNLAYDSDRDRLVMHGFAPNGQLAVQVPGFSAGQDIRDTREYEVGHTPHLRNRFPFDGFSRVLESQNIQFDICDIASDFDFTSLEVTVGGVPAYSASGIVKASGTDGESTSGSAIFTSSSSNFSSNVSPGDRLEIREGVVSGTAYRLWAIGSLSGLDRLVYSEDDGASWISIPTDLTIHGVCGLGGPENGSKVYVTGYEYGIFSVSENGRWTLEYDILANHPDMSDMSTAYLGDKNIWSAADDSRVSALVRVTTGTGRSYTRNGVPGSPWVEHDFGSRSIGKISGTSDGSAVFCTTFVLGFPKTTWYLHKLETSGAWTEVAFYEGGYDTYIKDIHVVSSTEVWISGHLDADLSGSGPDDWHDAIWLWNGSILSLEVDLVRSPMNLPNLAGCLGIWLEPDGSHGWASFFRYSSPVYLDIWEYDGASWSFSQSTGHYLGSVFTQVPYDRSTAKLHDGNSYISYDGFSWTTSEVTPITGSTGDGRIEYIKYNLSDVPYQDKGVYVIDSVDSPTQLTLQVAPTVTASNIDFAVYSGSGFVAPFDGPESSLEPSPSEGFRMVLDSTEDFENGSTVEVVVTIDDLDGNSLNRSWEFTILEQPSSGARLWATGESDGVYYSENQGVSWTAVDMSDVLAIESFFNIGGIWGPTDVDKVYCLFYGIGVMAYQDGNWTIEHSEADTYINEVRDFGACGTWCSDNDSIVIAWRIGVYEDQIRVRPGPPGTPWQTEFTGTTSDYGEPFDVHGNGDGSEIFAVTWAYDSSEYGILYRRDSGGTWNEVARVTADNVEFVQVRVVSATEVYVFGSEDTGDGNNNHSRIWKWDGAALTVVCDLFDPDYGGYAAPFLSAWMARDGSEGLAMINETNQWPSFVYSEQAVRYDGISWEILGGFYNSYITYDLQQRDGNQQSAIWTTRTYDAPGELTAYDGQNFWPPYEVRDENYSEHTIGMVPRSTGGSYVVPGNDKIYWLRYIEPEAEPQPPDFVRAINEYTIRLRLSYMLGQEFTDLPGGILNPSSYQIEGGFRKLTALFVEQVDSYTVDVTTLEMTNNAPYFITQVTPEETSTNGFLGIGVHPFIVSVSNSDYGILEVVFSEEMNTDASFGRATSYIIEPQGDASPVFVNEVSVESSTKVILYFSGGGSTYVLSVPGLMDVAGNYTSPSSFIFKIYYPGTDELSRGDKIFIDTDLGPIQVTVSNLSRRRIEDLVIQRIRNLGHSAQISLISDALKDSGINRDEQKLKLFKG